METAKWPELTFRITGFASLLVSSVGALATILDVVGVGLSGFKHDSLAPYFDSLFWVMIAMNFAFAVALAIAGLRLLQNRTQGLIICNVLFPVEVAYFLVVSHARLPGVPDTLQKSLTFASYMSNAGTVVQWTTGFPIVALIALNIAQRRRAPSIPACGQDTSAI